MAEGPGPSIQATIDEEFAAARRDMFERAREKRIKTEKFVKKVFSSVQWYYPVHKYIGDIVQDNQFSIEYEEEHEWICFEMYCDTISDIIMYINGPREVAAAVTKVLPTRRNVLRGLPSDEDSLISESEAIYIMGIYNLECFQFLMRSFAIGIKETSLVYMEKQLRDLAEKDPCEKLKEDIREFASKHADDLVEEQKKAIDGLEELCAHRNLLGLKRTSPLCFMISEGVDPEDMPPVPNDPELWNEYFLQVCSTRLSLALEKEKEQWDADFSEHRECLRPRMIRQFKRLKDILSNPGVRPTLRKYPFFTGFIQIFREEVSKLKVKGLH